MNTIHEEEMSMQDTDALGDLAYLHEQIATLTKERDIKQAIIADTIEDEEMAKKSLRPYLTEFELEGDSYGVPGFVQWIDTLIMKYNTVTHERDVARRALDILHNITEYNWCDINEENFGSCGGCKKSEKDCHGYKLKRALAMAEAEISTEEAKTTAIETSEAIEVAHEHAAKSKLVFENDPTALQKAISTYKNEAEPFEPAR